MAGQAGGRHGSVIRVGTLNVRSAVHKGPLIVDIINSKSLDVLVVTETWFQPHMPDTVINDILPDGYHSTHYFRPSKGGGISIVYRRELRSSILRVSCAATTYERVTIKFTLGAKRLNIVEIYRPPPTPTKLFFTELSELLHEFNSMPGSTALCGDFNCPGTTTDTVNKHLIDTVKQFNFAQDVTVSTTWSSSGVGNILDLIIHNDLEAVSKPIVSDVGISDHMLVMCTLKCDSIKASVASFTYRDIKQSISRCYILNY